MRALRSPAISDLASVVRVFRKLSLNPRTPTRAATPTATDSTTNANLPGADFRSLQPIAAARFQPRARLAILRLVLGERFGSLRRIWQRILHNHPVFQHDLPICATG